MLYLACRERDWSLSNEVFFHCRMSHALLLILESVHQRGLRMSQLRKSSRRRLNKAVIMMSLWMVQVISYLFAANFVLYSQYTAFQVNKEVVSLVQYTGKCQWCSMCTN